MRVNTGAHSGKTLPHQKVSRCRGVVFANSGVMRRHVDDPAPIPVNLLQTFLTPAHEPSTISSMTEPNPIEPRILLVGEEFSWVPPNATLANRKVVRALSKEEGIERIASEHFDGIVAGLPEIGKNLALLNTASSRQPELVCGLRAEAAKIAQLALSHPVIPSTQSLEVLDDLVRTMFATARWNADPSFVNLKAQIRKIPALPTLYTEITTALQKEDTSLEQIADLITCEATVSAKLLQVVNSPVFALRQRVTSIRDASNFLGIQRLRALVLSTSLIAQCDASRCPAFVPGVFEHHSLKIADWSARITIGETRNRPLGELAFTAGLLHQFGILLLAANLPESYSQVLSTAAAQNVSIARVERATYGVTHAELAAFLLASWHIPFPIVNAVAFHGRPSACDETAFSPLTAVHLASAIDVESCTGVPDYDRSYLERLGLLDRPEHWTRALSEAEAA